MRDIAAEAITQEVKRMCIESCYHLGADVIQALKEARDTEPSPIGKSILDQLVENAEIADQGKYPLCQDTGFTVIMVELGQDARIVGADLNEAINQGVRQGYAEGYLRKSIVRDPLRRVNTGDNTPAVIWLEMVAGDKVKIQLAPKGGGCENMSASRILKPSQGVEGVKDFVISTVSEGGGKPCPPIIVGVGIGGTFEKCAFLAKKAALRDVGDRNPDKFYADMEDELLDRVNRLGIGPLGLGGRTTALDVHVEVFPCHIASLPVAVNIQCHSARHKETVI